MQVVKKFEIDLPCFDVATAFTSAAKEADRWMDKLFEDAAAKRGDAAKAAKLLGWEEGVGFYETYETTLRLQEVRRQGVRHNDEITFTFVFELLGEE